MHMIPTADNIVSEMHRLQPPCPISILSKLWVERTEEWDKGGRRAGAARQHEDEGQQKLEEKDDDQLFLWQAKDITAFTNTKPGFLKNRGISWCWTPLLHLWIWWWNKEMLWVNYKLTRLDLASWLCKFFRHRHGLHPTHSHSSALSYNASDATSLQMAQF
jgi:hypothetical protein